MSWWQDRLQQLSGDSYLDSNKSHSTHSRDATRRIPPLIQRVHHFPPDLRVKKPGQWVLASSILYVSQFSRSVISNSFVAPWTAACQASLPIAHYWSLLKLVSIVPVMSSNHLILCHPLLLLPSIFPSISLFQCISSSHQFAKVLEFHLQDQFFQQIFRTDFL